MRRLSWNLSCLFSSEEEFLKKAKTYCESSVASLHKDDLFEIEKILVYSNLLSYRQNNFDFTSTLHEIYCKLYEKNYNIQFKKNDFLLQNYINTYAELKNINGVFRNHISSLSEYSKILQCSRNFAYNREIYRKYSQKVLKKRSESIWKSVKLLEEDKFPYMDIVDDILSIISKEKKLIKNIILKRQNYLKLSNMYFSDMFFECNSQISVDINTLYEGMSSILDKKNMEIVNKIFNDGWIEISEELDQNLTIFSNIVHPFILTNFNGNLSTGLALVHEIGHVLQDEYDVRNEIYDEITSITLELLIYKYLEKIKKNCIYKFLANERCILDIIKILLKIKIKNFIFCKNGRNLSDVNFYWESIFQDMFYDNKVKKIDEDLYQWINIDFSIPISQDFAYLIGTCSGLCVYYDEYLISELLDKANKIDIKEFSTELKNSVEKIIKRI